jgi:hypothetical protein
VVCPKGDIGQYVDDVLVAAEDKDRDRVVKLAVEAAESFVVAARQHDLVVSSKKSVVMAKSSNLAKEVKKGVMKKTGFNLNYKESAIHLGIDGTTGRRRCAAKAKKARSLAVRRVARAVGLSKTRKNAAKIFRTAAKQQATFNSAVDGLSPGELAKMRRLARYSCQNGNAGSCATMIIALGLGQGGDPAIGTIQGQVKEWLHLWAKADHAKRRRIAKAWTVIKKKLSAKDENIKWRNAK